MKSKLTQKELDEIRNIAIKLYQESDPEGRMPADFRFLIIVEATIELLARLKKDENI
jgi:hypothetical protein